MADPTPTYQIRPSNGGPWLVCTTIAEAVAAVEDATIDLDFLRTVAVADGEAGPFYVEDSSLEGYEVRVVVMTAEALAAVGEFVGW